jgi:drug/metabolite transporter (DMT)-like permease
MAFGAFWFSVMSLLVKLAGQRLPSQQIVLVRGVVTLVLSIALLLHARVPMWGQNHSLLVLRGLLGFGALSAFYFSLVHLPLAEATVIQYTNPVFTAILAAVLLGERVGRGEAACIAASMAGVLLIARPGFLFGAASAIDARLVLVAVAGALCSAGAYTTVRHIGSREHPLVVVFYFPLVTVPAVLPFVLPGWIWPTPVEWAILMGVGVSTQIAQVYMTRGLQLEPAGRATAVGYLQIIFAAGWGALVFADHPDAWTLGGASLILGSTLLLSRTRARSKPA